MATPQARREALGPLGLKLLQLIPRVAFVSTIVISILTPPQPLIWMVYVFFYGESPAHLEDGAPPLAQFIDSHGRSHYERLSDSKWSTLLHVLPAILWLLLWPSQFTSKFRWKSPWIHRVLGTALMIDAVLLLVGVPTMCGAGACYTGPYPRPWPMVLDGLWKPPFLPLFWVYGAVSLYQAYIAARHRQFKQHRRWIIRLNALFLGVTIGRPIIGFLAVIWWNHPQAHDPNFRWQFFWDVVWKGMLGYIVLAEMWLAIESYFGLGAVAVRPPPSSGASGKNLPPPRP